MNNKLLYVLIVVIGIAAHYAALRYDRSREKERILELIEYSKAMDKLQNEN